MASTRARCAAREAEQDVRKHSRGCDAGVWEQRRHTQADERHERRQREEIQRWRKCEVDTKRDGSTNAEQRVGEGKGRKRKKSIFSTTTVKTVCLYMQLCQTSMAACTSDQPFISLHQSTDLPLFGSYKQLQPCFGCHLLRVVSQGLSIAVHCTVKVAFLLQSVVREETDSRHYQRKQDCQVGSR